MATEFWQTSTSRSPGWRMRGGHGSAFGTGRGFGPSSLLLDSGKDMRVRLKGMRAFDPRVVGHMESGAWVAYYRKQWVRFLVCAVGMVRVGFAMSWPRTVRGAWLVLRANQLWAPVTGNDPEGARQCMRRFYDIVTRTHGERFDTVEAARLEVEWWRVHREAQRYGGPPAAVVDALAALYAHVYRVEPAIVRTAAAERAAAMVISDRWVAEGCDPESPELLAEQAALVRSYAALLAAVYHPARLAGLNGNGRS